ncbi:unnamed protein product [Sphagnum jensenii]
MPLLCGAQTFTFNHAFSYPSLGSGVGLYGWNTFSSMYGYQLNTNNPGFQPLINNVIDVAASGTTTTYTSANGYDAGTANQFVGWTLTVLCHYNGTNGCSGGAQGCSYAITANTAGYNGGSNPITVTWGTPCAAAITAGDVIERSYTATAGTLQGYSTGGTGATFSFDTAAGNLPPSTVTGLPAPSQCLQITSPSGGYAYFSTAFDGQLGYLFNGNYTGTLYAKLISGSGALASMTVQRAGANSPIIAASNQAVTSSWTTLSWSGAGTETTSTTPGAVTFQWVINSTAANVIDVCGAQVQETAHTNASPLRDAVITQIKAQNPGSLRYNLLNVASGGTLGCSLVAMLQPLSQRGPCNGATQGTSYTSYGSALGLDDFMKACLATGVKLCEVSVPPTLTTAELSNLADYLGGGTGTAYGAIRAALGETSSWTSVIPTIVIDDGNETWNTTVWGAYISGAPYHQSGGMAHTFCAALKASASWNSSVENCAVNVQQGAGINNATAIQAVDPAACPGSTRCIDVLNSSDYQAAGTPNVTDCVAADWLQDSYTETWANVNDSSLQVYLDLSQAAATTYKLAAYEAGIGAASGNCTVAQITGIPEGEGWGLTDALSYLEQQRGFPGTLLAWNYWELNGKNRSFSSTASSSPATTIAGWGLAWGTGGNQANLRPTVYAQAAANACANLGTGYAVTYTSIPTYSSSARNGIPAETNVPLLRAFDFSSGSTECIVMVNTDSASHTVTAAGTYAPTGSLRQVSYTGSSLQANNETVANTVTNTTSTVSASSTYTLPAYSLVTIQSGVVTQYQLI